MPNAVAPGLISSLNLDIRQISGHAGPFLREPLSYTLSGFKEHITLVRENQWRYSLGQADMIQLANSTTDLALPGKFFATLTNSGTLTAGSQSTGYEDMGLSTTGASSGNTNSLIAYDGFFPPAAGFRTMAMGMEFYAADPNTAAYDFWLGSFNKQTAPGGTAPTDGVWFKGVTVGANIAIIGYTNSNNGTAVATPTLYTILSGQPQSIGVGFVWQVGTGVDFYVKAPAAPATSGVLSLNDGWVYKASINLAPGNAAKNAAPLSTVMSRPTFAHITRTAATHALNVESMWYGIQNWPLR